MMPFPPSDDGAVIEPFTYLAEAFRQNQTQLVVRENVMFLFSLWPPPSMSCIATCAALRPIWVPDTVHSLSESGFRNSFIPSHWVYEV
jgi:hypothetical protein